MYACKTEQERIANGTDSSGNGNVFFLITTVYMYHRLLQVVSGSVLLLNLVEGCLYLDQVLRVAGGVLISDDQPGSRRETLQVHSSTSLWMGGCTDGSNLHACMQVHVCMNINLNFYLACTHTHIHVHVHVYMYVTSKITWCLSMRIESLLCVQDHAYINIKLMYTTFGFSCIWGSLRLATNDYYYMHYSNLRLILRPPIMYTFPCNSKMHLITRKYSIKILSVTFEISR